MVLVLGPCLTSTDPPSFADSLNLYYKYYCFSPLELHTHKINKYDKHTPQSHTADKHTAPRRKATGQ